MATNGTVATTDSKPGKKKTGGVTTFDSTVIETIAGIAAREVPGVYKLGKGTLGDAVARVAGTSDTSHGVHAEIGTREVAIDVELVAEYGISLYDLAAEVRTIVAVRLEHATRLLCKEVNVAIVGIHVEQDVAPAPAPRVQ